MSAMMFAGMCVVVGLLLCLVVASVWFAWSVIRDVCEEEGKGKG